MLCKIKKPVVQLQKMRADNGLSILIAIKKLSQGMQTVRRAIIKSKTANKHTFLPFSSNMLHILHHLFRFVKSKALSKAIFCGLNKNILPL